MRIFFYDHFLKALQEIMSRLFFTWECKKWRRKCFWTDLFCLRCRFLSFSKLSNKFWYIFLFFLFLLFRWVCKILWHLKPSQSSLKRTVLIKSFKKLLNFSKLSYFSYRFPVFTLELQYANENTRRKSMNKRFWIKNMHQLHQSVLAKTYRNFITFSTIL